MKKVLTILGIAFLLTFASALGLTHTLQAYANSSIAYDNEPLTPETGKAEPAASATAESNAADGGAFERDGARTEQFPSKEIAYPESADVAGGVTDEPVQIGHLPKQPAIPARLRISAIGLNNPIVSVGLNSKGEMDVPSGTTKNIGWYSPGTVPGNVGSAVLDAHVFAAFANLHKVEVGDLIEVVMSDNSVRHFKVTETHVYPLAQVPAERLFMSADGKHLNLITCAGKLVPNRSTYDHRLIVYTTLVEE